MMDTPDYFDADHIGHDEGNLLSGIDNKTIRRQEISICLQYGNTIAVIK